MVKRATRKYRTGNNRSRKKIILIAVNGLNPICKESLHYNNKDSVYNLVLVEVDGTVPINVIKETREIAVDWGIEPECGDKIYIVFDTNSVNEEQKYIINEYAERNSIRALFSDIYNDLGCLLTPAYRD